MFNGTTRAWPLRPFEGALRRHVPGAQKLVRAGISRAREGFVMAFRNPRLMARAERLAGHHLHRQVRDPPLRSKVEPG